MSIEKKLIKVEPDSPYRCPSPGPMGDQCEFGVVPGTGHCPKHGGILQNRLQEKQKLHDYRLQIWQENLDRFAESDNVKTLRGEIAILRMTLQATLELCKDPQQLVLYSTRISQLVANVEKVTVSCDKLESRMGLLLDKSAALVLASQVVQLITEHVADPAKVDAISKGIIDLLSELGNGSVQ